MRTKLTSRGFTLIEVAIALAILGIVFVGVLTTLGGSQRGQALSAQQRQAHALATGLLSEVLQQLYQDADSALFGPEGGEGTTSRQDFDDVDDYDGWTESPPQEKDGTALTDLAAYERSVVVEYVMPGDFDQVISVDMGAKRVTVIVRRDGKELAALTGVRTSGVEAMTDGQEILRAMQQQEPGGGGGGSTPISKLIKKAIAALERQ